MSLDAVCEAGFAPALEATQSGRIPGTALGVVRADGTSAVRLAGMAALVTEREALTRAHWFDLASLSKVIAMPSRMKLMSE